MAILLLCIGPNKSVVIGGAMGAVLFVAAIVVFVVIMKRKNVTLNSYKEEIGKGKIILQNYEDYAAILSYDVTLLKDSQDYNFMSIY